MAICSLRPVVNEAVGAGADAVVWFLGSDLTRSAVSRRRRAVAGTGFALISGTIERQLTCAKYHPTHLVHLSSLQASQNADKSLHV
jgi:hypothetical protein